MTSQDARIRSGQCGDTAMIAGREFVCIADPHPGGSPPEHMRGYQDDRPRGDYHFFIRRFPEAR